MPRWSMALLLLSACLGDLLSDPASDGDGASPVQERAEPPAPTLQAPPVASGEAPTDAEVRPLGAALDTTPPPEPAPRPPLTAEGAVAEVEPNDTWEQAQALTPGVAVAGTAARRDVERFTFDNDRTQAWRISSSGGRCFTLIGPGGRIATGERAPGDDVCWLTDVVLQPGAYRIEFAPSDGSYLLRAEALGAIADNRESEPNDDLSRAMRLRFSEPRTGALAVHGDRDLYRFSMPGEGYVRVTVRSPAQAPVRLELQDVLTRARVARIDAADDEPLTTWSGWLLEGEYTLEARSLSGVASDAPYVLGLERLDPWLLPDDLEPNDEVSWQRDLPSDGWMTGHTDALDRKDVVRLPALEAPTRVRITLHPPNQGDDAEVPEARARVRVAQPDGAGTVDTSTEDDGSLVATVPAGPPHTLVVSGSGPYRLQVTGLPVVEHTPSPVRLGVTDQVVPVAAYWAEAQRVEVPVHVHNAGSEPVEVTLSVRTTHAGLDAQLPGSFPLDPGGETTVTLPVLVEADLNDDDVQYVTIAASTGPGTPAPATLALEARCGATPVGPTPHRPLPEALRGAVNVAAAARGGSVGPDHPAVEDVIDGFSPNDDGYSHDPPVELTFDLAGDEPHEIVGALVTTRTRSGPVRRAVPLSLSLSTDGERFTQVYTGTLRRTVREQAFPFPATRATHARLSVPAIPGLDRGGFVNLGEVKWLARPGSQPLGRINLADPALGGHVVWSSPHVRKAQVMLTDDADASLVKLDATTPGRFVLGFHHTRAARVTALDWVTSDRVDASKAGMSRVEIAVSTTSPAGPWEALGAWDVDPTPGATTTWMLPEARWIRYLRVTSSEFTERTAVMLPETVRVWEAPADESVTSAIGEYGQYAMVSAYEDRVRHQASEVGADAGDSADEATLLALGERRADAVSVGVDEDWYRVEVPEGRNTLTVEATGRPAFNGSLEVQDASGAVLPVERLERGRFRVRVRPGTHRIRVWEPPRNIALSWDNSGSVSGYYGAIYQAVDSFASGVQPGREYANLLPFQNGGGNFLLDEWTDQPDTLRTGIARYDRSDGSSEAELALFRATADLSRRDGTAAILVLTDAETHTSRKNAALWDTWAELRPRVFTVELHIGDVAWHQDLMQSWSRADDGHYTWFATHADLDVAFRRAACHLRRPVRYDLVAEATLEEPPPPGRVLVVAPDGIADGGLEIILDASGSMLMAQGDALRWQVARDALTTLVNQGVPEGTPVALRAFGHREPRSCETWLEVPPAPLDRQALTTVIARIKPQMESRTPLGASLAAVGEDLADLQGPKRVVVLTDGDETCRGDPAAAIEGLKEAGIDVRVSIVGFEIDDAAVRQDFERWATLGGGRYFDAHDEAELTRALQDALRPKVEILDAGGEVVAEGAVGDKAIRVAPGTYTVRVLSTPPARFADVQVPSGDVVELTVGE